MRAVLTLVALCWVGCGAATQEGQLSLSRRDSTETAGVYRRSGHVLRFSASRVGADKLSLAVDWGPKRFVAELDAHGGALWLTGGGAVLTAAERELLAALSEAVVQLDAEHEQFLARAASYWASAPEELAHDDLRLKRDRAGLVLGDEGVVCLDARAGEVVTATWDTAAGAVRHTEVLVGSDFPGTGYECMGKCGRGCSSRSYTKDCVDHDACSWTLKATGGAFHDHCGDEFRQAADDFLFGC